MTYNEIMQELDNLQQHAMPLFIEEVAQRHNDRIDDIHWLRWYGVLVCRTRPQGSNSNDLLRPVYPRRPIESYNMKV